ncbi:MAG: lysine--tRNA ligase [Deltaproteobacteria bacterium]|nr:lysine--tRNA ligase [Deltaproteobacteria bacterium]
MPRPIDTILENRLKKLDKLEAGGTQGFPNDFVPDSDTGLLHRRFDEVPPEVLEAETARFGVAGRIMTLRSMGKACFFHFKDRHGSLQVYVRKDVIGDEQFERFGLFEVGDIVGVVGRVMKTRTGELTLLAEAIRLVTKALRPLPEKFHGLQDLETRFRQRYVDLIMNDWVRELFVTRSRIVSHIRSFLDGRGFLEVETPMMHAIAGGAAARPFVTHHNALDIDLYLRIAPELYLKRLLVGGFERVYEINRNFRNEGLSHKHNPEFTMLEFYWAYATFNDLMSLTEELLGGLFAALRGEPAIEIGGKRISMAPPYRKLPLAESLSVVGGLPPDKVADRDFLTALLRRQEVEVIPAWGIGKLQVEVYDKLVESRIEEPTFIIHHPVETSPLSRRNNENPEVVDRFELIIAGREIANAFSELNDPRDQRQRFEDQMRAREAGDDEAHQVDWDYVRALEYGMPPAAGQGIGIDRLVMLATGMENIKEVILFPLLKPEAAEPDTEEPAES